MTELQHDGRPEYVPGEWRDLPRGQAGYIRPHAPVTKATGLDWDALTPKCRQCGQPSGQLAEGARCPTCRGVTPVDVFATGRKTTTAVTHSTGTAAAYDEDHPEDLAARFNAPDDTRLGRELGELAATDPAVAAASKALDTAVALITQPAEPHKETTVTSPPFPTYIVDIAVVMRDSEGHHDPAVRAARKTVANALRGLNRELLRVGSPAASTAPDDQLGSPRRRGPLADHHDQVLAAAAAGATSNTIGAKYGVSGSAVRQYLRRHATNPTGATA